MFGKCGSEVWADFAFVEDNRYVYQALEFDGGRQSVAVEGVDGFFSDPFLCVDFGLEALQGYGASARRDKKAASDSLLWSMWSIFSSW